MPRSPTPPILIPLLEKRPRVRVTYHDTKPASLRLGDENDDALTLGKDESAAVTTILLSCGVCQEHQHRYVCPKCDVLYCSVACYQKHGLECTEQFHHKRVTDVMKREVNERRDEMHDMLNRFANQHHSSADEMQASTVKNDGQMSQEDLLHLLQVLERGDEQELDRILATNPMITTKVDTAVQNGELGEWLLDPWFPWWQTELATASECSDSLDNTDDDDEDIIGDSSHQSSNLRLKTLDERLLEIPDFTSFFNSHSRPSPPQLRFHFLELLYTTVLTLRLYHGVTNSCDLAISFTAALTLVNFSTVLSLDARYENLPAVLLSCTQRPTHASKGGEMSWNVILQDVIQLCRLGRRFVGRCLLEALDIIQAGTNAAKLNSSNNSCADVSKRNLVTIQKAELQLLRRARKKLEFYLSWSQQKSINDLLTTLARDIDNWMMHWKLDTGGDDDAIEITHHIHGR